VIQALDAQSENDRRVYNRIARISGGPVTVAGEPEYAPEMRPPRRRRRSPIEERDLWKASLLRSFVELHGIAKLNPKVVVAPGVRIGAWAQNCRYRQRNDRMPNWLARELEAIPGWSWDPIGDRHRANVELLKAIIKRTDLDAKAVFMLGDWIVARRARHRLGTLDKDSESELEALPGWTWSQRSVKRSGH
jgi:hypothetical protein